MPYVAVSVAVSGRNTVATTAIGVTDANGLISYKVVDAGTSGTKDTVTFTGAGSATAYVNYGSVVVAKVTVTGGSTAADAANGATNKTAISSADNGPEASAKPIKAVVKDASGNLLAGVPVTFTVDKGLIKKTASVDYSVVYTGSDGSATTYAFNWLVGKQTITATAGGVSSSDYITWAATDATSARVLSSVVNGTVITYTVSDRFGNPVKGVTINLTRTGSGLFGNGSSTQDVTTGSDGTVDATFVGTGSAVATLASTYAEAYAPAGQYDFTAGDTYTAAVAGTTSGTGASLAPAGVYTVSNATASSTEATTAAQAAVDAANEATDAANAATDAANNAMDSADAAQQAALDAGDKADAALAAVTDLATKVSAIATQIAALSALVKKIAAKVKA
jgi:methyl-accepting chemotaxis protein